MAESERHDEENVKMVEGTGLPNHENGDQETVSPSNHKHVLLAASCIPKWHWLKAVSG